jgi:pSer/pThr/pTyr-binding forkhead associated (FHA) protein
VRKEAWVTIVEGPLTGKEFILYRQVTTIGSGAHCDIPLLKDRSVAPEHARVQQSGGGFLLVSLVGADGVLVNDHPSGSHPLSSGDVIRIGMTTLFYQDRAVQ